MRNSIKISFFFSFMLILSNFIIVSAYNPFIYEDYVEYWDRYPEYCACIDQYFLLYKDSGTEENYTMIDVTLNLSRDELWGFSLRNLELINATLEIAIGITNAPEDTIIDIYAEALVNYYPVYTIEDELDVRAVPPETEDEIDFVIYSDGAQLQVNQAFLRYNLSCSGESGYNWLITAFVLYWYRGYTYGFLENSILDMITEFVPIFLMVIIFPVIFFTFDISKKLSIILGLGCSTMVLSLLGLIGWDIALIMYITTALLGYYYIKIKREDLL